MTPAQNAALTWALNHLTNDGAHRLAPVHMETLRSMLGTTDEIVALRQRVAELEASLLETEESNELSIKCLDRARELWQTAHPQADYWPDGAKNIVWVLEDNARLRERVAELEALCLRAHDSMEFHAWRCPLDPFNNYSGSEEHLAEYRQVVKDIANAPKEKGDANA